MSEAQQAELMPPEKKNGKLAKREQQAIAPAATPMELLSIAMTQGMDVEKLTKLFDLQERWERNEQKKAFVAAMNGFKAEVQPVLKMGHVEYQRKDGRTTKYDHARLEDACEQMIPVLAKHGFTHRWRPDPPTQPGRIRITCVLTHSAGHSEEATLEGAPDDSDGKNPVQAAQSTTTYLERYTFFAVTGTAPKGADNDGRGAISEPLPGIDDMLRAIAEAPDTSALKMVYTSAYNKAKLAKNQQAELLLIAAKDKRKAELTAEDAA